MVSYLPLLWPHLQRLWYSEHYRFFPLVVLGFAGLVWTRLRKARVLPEAARREPGLAESLWLFAALLLLAGAVLLWSAWLAAVSAVVAARAVLLHLGASRGEKFTLVWLLLWLLVPLPFRWDVQLNAWLLRASAFGGSCLLDYFRVPHLVTGRIIQVPGYEVPLGEACHGIQAVILLFSLSVLFVLWLRRPPVHSLLFLASAFFWAAVLNAVHVAVTVYGFVEAGLDLSTGWLSRLFEVGLYGLGILLLFGTDRLLIFFLVPVPEIRDPDEWYEDLGPPQTPRAPIRRPAPRTPSPCALRAPWPRLPGG